LTASAYRDIERRGTVDATTAIIVSATARSNPEAP
jgi:hypothetical protein